MSLGHSRVITVKDSQFGHLNLAPVTDDPARAPREIKVRKAPQLIFTPLITSKFPFAWVRITNSCGVTAIVFCRPFPGMTSPKINYRPINPYSQYIAPRCVPFLEVGEWN